MENVNSLQIAFLDVGHGDTIVISFEEKHVKKGIIIDCNDAITTKNYVINNNIQVIDYIVITHLHRDHYKGINQLIDLLKKNNIKIGTICWEKDKCIRTDTNENKMYKLFTNMLNEKHINDGLNYISKRFNNNEYIRLENGSMDNFRIEIIYPNSYYANYFDDKNINNTSAVIRIEFNNYRIILPGDLEGEGWYMLSSYVNNLESDILKAPHHGDYFEKVNKTLSLSEVIDLVNPRYFVISTGQNDKYKHPSKETIKYITDKNINVLCTQATDLCDEKRMDKKDIIISKLKINNIRKNSCPCCGDIIFQIDEDIKLISPEPSIVNEIKTQFEERICNNL